jgi:hypothetical protein
MSSSGPAGAGEQQLELAALTGAALHQDVAAVRPGDALTSASPRPVPRGGPLSPLRNRSKTCRSSSAGMPWPVSATIMRTGSP